MRRMAEFVFVLMALGELAVGIAALAYPPVIAFVADARLDANGLLVARMLGAAVLALGVTWWTARNDPERLSRHAAGFIAYNIGVGALFALAATAAARPALPALVAVTHLVAGGVLTAASLVRGGEKVN